MSATDADIAKLEETLGKATAGPWWTDAKYDGRERACAIIAARTDAGPLPGNPTRGVVAFSSAALNTDARQCEANATAIVAAVNLAPALIARLRAAEAEAAYYKACNQANERRASRAAFRAAVAATSGISGYGANAVLLDDVEPVSPARAMAEKEPT